MEIKPFFQVSAVGLKRVGGVSGLPPADLYIDARAFPDQAQSGEMKLEDRAFLIQSSASAAVIGLMAVVNEAIKHIPHRRRAEVDPYARTFKIVVFCAYGVHRSVAIREILIEYLLSRGWRVI